MRERWIRFLPALFIVGIPSFLVRFAPGSGGMLYGHDVMETFFYLRAMIGNALAHGSIPTWDSHAMCGFPTLANPQSGILYPLTWPVAFLPPGYFWGFSVLVHMILSGAFAFQWLRRGLRLSRGASLVGALLFMGSGFLVTRVWAGHLPSISTYPWVAGVLWRLERVLAQWSTKRWALLSGAIALMCLAGFPPFAFLCLLLFGARVLFNLIFEERVMEARRRTILRVVLTATVGALWAAPQLLPTIELVPHIQRVTVNTYQFVTSYSLPPENLITFLCPAILGDDVGTAYWGRWAIWEVCGYVGIGSLTLSTLALGGRHRQRLFWLAVAVLSLLLALGRYTPVFRLFYSIVPGSGLFRVPGRYLLLFTVAITPLSAMGFDRLWNQANDPRKQTWPLALGLGVVLLALVAGIVLVSNSQGGDSTFWQSALQSAQQRPDTLITPSQVESKEFRAQSYRSALGSLVMAAIFAAFLGSLLLAYRRGLVTGRVASVSLGLLATLELLSFGHRYFRTSEQSGLYWPRTLTEMLRDREGGIYRLASSTLQDVGRCQMEGLDHLGGYDPMMVREYPELMNALHGFPHDKLVVFFLPGNPHAVLSMLGARLWILPHGAPPLPGWKALGRLPDFTLYEAPEALPRAYLVSESVILPSRENRLAYLVGPSFDPRKTVVLETDPAISLGGDSKVPPSVRIKHSGEADYLIEVDAPKGGFLVLTETYYPGWRAEVDGKTVRILRANHLVQAIPLGPGKHTVRFSFACRFLVPGFILSGLGGMLVAGAALRDRLRRVPAPPTTSWA